ncbi:MAG: tetratricopeptide repeat protein [Burkholderiales bacterium]
MSTPAADQNLLFGILAVQMDFINRDALIAGMHGWILEKSKPLGQILLEQNALRADTRALLEALVQKHLELHGNDAEKSLAAVSSVSSIRNDLENIRDPDVQASLMTLPSAPAGSDVADHCATVSLGVSTSAGTRFHILRPHAKGGLGEVFVALDEELHREVALKEIQNHHAHNAENRARFMMEAEITGGLEHPGIVPVYGLGTYADGRPYYAMRFIRGDSLQDAITHYHQDEPRLPARGAGERTLELRKLLGRFIDVCQAIQYAHDRGILHRDLKPGNIMLGKYGETLVVDWGLAKTVGRAETLKRPGSTEDERTLKVSSESGSAETLAGTALGTPAFMSPEQAAGRLDLLGPASDVYSLGATLYALLTGQAPVRGKDVAEVLTKVQRGDFARPRQLQPDLTLALEAICVKAMALKPADRYASPRALADDLERWLADEPVSAMKEPMTVKAGRWVRRHKPLVSGAAAALLVGLLALSAGAFWYEHQQAETARKEAFAEAETQRKEALAEAETQRKQVLAQAEVLRKQSIAEEKVRQALDQARKTRDELHKILKKPNGVQELLNQPAVWQAQIKNARSDWERARDYADDTGDPHWPAEIKKREAELTRDQADHDLALRLEKIRMDRTTFVKRKFDTARPRKDYAAAFEAAGLRPEPGQEMVHALLIQQSAIKDQLVAALDNWAYLEHINKNSSLTGRLLEIARLSDPDPWRDKIRNLEFWKDTPAIAKLVQEAKMDRELPARQSPQMLYLVSRLLPEDKTQETWLRFAQTLHPTDFWISYRLASSLEKSKDAIQAAGFYRVALAIRPNDFGVYSNLGHVLHAQNDFPGAIYACKKAIDINPNVAEAWANLGSSLHAQQNLPEAVDAYKNALVINPQLATAWTNLGNVRRGQKDFSGAIDDHKMALAIDDQLATAWNNLGVVYHHDLKNIPDAIIAYKKAVEIDPEYALAWANLGLARQFQKELPEASDAYMEAVRISPKFAEVWINLGMVRRDQRDFSGAIKAYNNAIDINPRLAEAWNSLGIVLRDQKELYVAIFAYKKAININPQFAPAWNNLGNLYLFELKNPGAAINAYNKALAIDSNLMVMQSSLAHAKRMLVLDRELLGVLRGDYASVAKLLELADFSATFKEQYGDAVELYRRAFLTDPGTADQLEKSYRYNAACCAALAAMGKGRDADKPNAKEQTRLRKQAHDWLQADLTAHARLLKNDPAQLHLKMQHWQRDADLAGLRDEKELAKLPAGERDRLKKLWDEVNRLAKEAGSSYTQTEYKGQLGAKERERSHPIKMFAGKTYTIDMESPQFDTFLRLEDDKGRVVAANDDISRTNLNSRIVFTASKDGAYRIVATSYQQLGIGVYTITVREFAQKKN